jgi:dimethylargininase
MLTRALVRPPAQTFADGITTAGLGDPHHELALEQHHAYRAALEAAGLAVTKLPPDPVHPDSTFVEDTAVLAERCAVLTRPGAPSRAGEVEGIRAAVGAIGRPVEEIAAPGTLDGGDVCQVEERFLIGVSHRTNEEGARQLAAALAKHGYESELVDVLAVPGLLHLKSGVTYLGEGRFAAIEALAGHAALRGAEVFVVEAEESYASNCLRVNDRVLFPLGFPRLAERLSLAGYRLELLDVSEFQKMDGGLTCLSLRF